MSAAPTASTLPAVAPGVPAVGHDRRRSERVPQMIEGWMSSASGKGAKASAGSAGRRVFVRDLSLHGVGLVSDKASEVGDRCWVLIHRGQLRLSTRVQIVACRRRDDGHYDIGGEFY